MQSFFDPVVDRIIDLLDVQFTDLENRGIRKIDVGINTVHECAALMLSSGYYSSAGSVTRHTSTRA